MIYDDVMVSPGPKSDQNQIRRALERPGKSGAATMIMMMTVVMARSEHFVVCEGWIAASPRLPGL